MNLVIDCVVGLGFQTTLYFFFFLNFWEDSGGGGCGFVMGMGLVMGLCRWWYGCGSVMVLCRGGMVAAVVVVGGRSHTGCVLCIMN